MKGLILLDWDGTIVDEQIRITDSRFQEVIQERIAEGWQVGLNSDTPLKRLQGWWKALGMNGPLIAERGAVIWWPNIQPMILSESMSKFSVARQEMVRLLTEMEGIALFFGDNTEFIRSVGRILSNDSVLVALDAYRVCSLFMFVRHISDGMLMCDIPSTERIQSLVKSVLPEHPLISEIDFNRQQCYLRVNALDTNKSTGAHVLLEKWVHPPKVYMIGDSIADYLKHPEIRQLAVSNAESAYKEVADRIATKSYAEGCVELLSALGPKQFNAQH